MKKHRSIFILIVSISLLSACSKSKTSDLEPAGTGKFTFDDIAYSGAATSVTVNGVTQITIGNDGSKSIVIDNVPSASSGNFTLANALSAAAIEGKEVYALSNVSIGGSNEGSASLSGTFTKTGATSFEFNGVFQSDASSTSTVTVSGSGSY